MRLASLELNEIEQCFSRLRSSAMQLGRENEIDSFASRVSAIREGMRSEASALELDVMLETLKEDVQTFLNTLQPRH